MDVGFDQSRHDGATSSIDLLRIRRNGRCGCSRSGIGDDAVRGDQSCVRHRWRAVAVDDLTVADEGGALGVFHGNAIRPGLAWEINTPNASAGAMLAEDFAEKVPDRVTPSASSRHRPRARDTTPPWWHAASSARHRRAVPWVKASLPDPAPHGNRRAHRNRPPAARQDGPA